MRLHRSRLTDEQTERLLEHFVAGTPARPAAELVEVNRNTARLFYHRLRVLIAQHLAGASPFEGEVELDEGCFAVAHEGARDRGAAREVPVFGLAKRGSKVYTVIAPDVQREMPPSTLKAKVRPDSIVYADAIGVRNVLDVSGFRYERLSDRERGARGRAHINSIENFWNQAKRHLRKYNGIPGRHFHLFLKECEWRFNYGSPKQLLETLKLWVKTRPD